ncbi:MAG: vitamin B12 dependent-methionine synthase activation domain-containing protein [Kiritimatiellae bacterium]|nr:vitamin B12 dependent-methionine synthase activation domain-containing protein [Kiritimatiellia bacterium]
MEILSDIPFSLDVNSLMKQAHIESGTDDVEELRTLIDVAMKVGKPKAVYAVSFVEDRNGDTLKIGGISFTSRTLSRNLASSERVFPLIATCGHEMDEAKPAIGDMLKEFWWDLIKAHLLSAADRHLNDYLHRTFRLGKTAIMRPGSGDASVWPIEQQQGLFALLGDVEQAIGVKLTNSFLMVPNKTTSGILFPTEVDFRSCEVCHRENCPSRHVAFNKQLWEEIRHD